MTTDKWVDEVVWEGALGLADELDERERKEREEDRDFVWGDLYETF